MKTRKTHKLLLWVSNMSVVGIDSDLTANYLDAAYAKEIAAKHGVRLEGQILLSAHRGQLWRAFREIAAAVAAAGHGGDTEDAPPPLLTAQRPHSKYAAAELERMVSTEAQSYKQWVKEARIEEEEEEVSMGWKRPAAGRPSGPLRLQPTQRKQNQKLKPTT